MLRAALSRRRRIGPPGSAIHGWGQPLFVLRVRLSSRDQVGDPCKGQDNSAMPLCGSCLLYTSPSPRD
eukprot:14110306-Alexandrium_andersonii.AAC.1